jgi:hypothetical protein
MKNKFGLLAIAAAVFLAGRQIFRKQETIRALNVNISKIDFNKKDLTFVVFVRIINPGNAPIRVNAVVGDIIWKDVYGAVLDYRNPVTIDPLGERTLQIPIKMNVNLVQLIQDLMMGKTKGLLTGKFEIKGSVNAEGFVVPLVYSQEVKIM